VPQKLLFNRLPPLTNLELYPLDERARFMAGGAQPDPGPDESLARSYSGFYILLTDCGASTTSNASAC
jgi:hypothetical protein